jgi:hypothetical protein
MDHLSDIIHLLRPPAVFSKPITGRGIWGVRYPADGRPGIAIVLEGRCWLAIDGAEPVLLDHRDFVLLPFSPAFALLSQPDAQCVPGRPSIGSGSDLSSRSPGAIHFHGITSEARRARSGRRSFSKTRATPDLGDGQ